MQGTAEAPLQQNPHVNFQAPDRALLPGLLEDPGACPSVPAGLEPDSTPEYVGKLKRARGQPGHLIQQVLCRHLGISLFLESKLSPSLTHLNFGSSFKACLQDHGISSSVSLAWHNQMPKESPSHPPFSFPSLNPKAWS